MRYYRLIAFLLVLISSSVNAQMSRVDGYEVVPFDATWDSLLPPAATIATYDGGTNDGKYSIPLPFDFPYDGVILPQGLMMAVGANGAISFANADIPPGQLIGNAEHPMLIGIFNGDIKQGSDTKSSAGADTIGLYQVTGEAPNRVFTIEYKAFHLRGGGSGGGKVDTLTAMQVKLYETSGVIEFIYRDHGLLLPSRLTNIPLCSIGLNGAPIPTFVSNLFLNDTRTIPLTDLRWTPGTASIDRVEKDELLQAYPNPASNWITISVPSTQTVKGVVAADAIGRTHILTMSNDGHVDISALIGGNYLLRIETDDRVYISHVSVVH